MDSSRGRPDDPPLTAPASVAPATPAPDALEAGPDAPPPSTARLARSAGIIGIATMASRVLGLIRDTVLAFFFGAGDAMDAYNVAYRIPNLLRDLFAEGAMSAAFVPTFTRYLTLKGRADAWRLGNIVINALVGATGLVVLLGLVFAEPLVRLFASDFASVPGKFELTVWLTRVMFPFLALVTVAAACMGMLNALGRFFIPAFAPAMYNIGTILTVVVLVPVFRSAGAQPITAVAIGTLVGGLGQILIQWVPLRREGFRYRCRLDLRDGGLRDIVLLMVPAVVGVGAVQLNITINTILASGEGTGAVSWLNYAFRLMYMPIGLFGVSIATAALPSISRQAARDETAAMRATMSSGLRMMLMFNVPAMAGLMVLAGPIVELLFERGHFTPADTIATAAAVVCFAPGLVGYSSVKIAAPTFYALKASRIPVTVSVLSVGVNIALNLAFIRVLSYRGLALGTAAAAIFNAAVLLALLRRRLGGLDGRRIGVALLKILAAAAVMAAAAWLLDGAAHGLVPGEHTLPRLVRLVLTIGTSLLVLAGAAKALHIREFDEAVRLVAGRLPGRRGRTA